MRVLTVDDSRAIRNIVVKQVQDLGMEVEEAEDGEEGLARLEESVYDCVVLDVTMPVLDGPGMLRRMREAGNKTPVLMLTSESKTSIIGDCLKLGISDYILKPFKSDELRMKLLKAMKLEGGTAGSVAPARPAPAEASFGIETRGHPGTENARQFIDVLVVDDMENVHKKLRSLVPTHLSVNGANSAQAALNICRERIYRLVLVDVEMPDVDSGALVSQLKLLQPHAAFIALSLRTLNDAVSECRKNGYEDVLFKPFDKNSVDDLLLRFFDDQEILIVEDNVLRAGAFSGREDRIDRYYERLEKVIPGAIEKLAAACFEDAIVDLGQAPIRPDRTPRLVRKLASEAERFGLQIRLAGPQDLPAALQAFTETAKIACFASVAEARATA